MKKKKKRTAAHAAGATPKKKKLSKEDRVALFVALGIVAVFLAVALVLLIVHLSGERETGTGESSTEQRFDETYDFETGDFRYSLYGTNTVEVFEYIGSWDSIVIPETVVYGGKEYRVVSISSYGIMTENIVTTSFSVTIPKSILNIDDTAIAYITPSGNPVYPTVIYKGSEADWNSIYMNEETQEWISDDTVFIFEE